MSRFKPADDDALQGVAPRDDRAPGRSSTSRLSGTRSTVVFRVETAEAAAVFADRFGPRDGNGVATGADAAVDRATSSSGQALPDAVRTRFEGSLGADLSAVRVHTGGESADAAGAVGARAYTTGQDIHFAAGQYAPADPFGLHLLAHEVAHTVQQAGGATGTQYKLEVSTPGDALEAEADRAADAMIAGQAASVTGATGVARKAIQRDGDPAAAPAGKAPDGANDADVKTQAGAERAKIQTEYDNAKTQLGMNGAAKADLDKDVAKAELALKDAQAAHPGVDPESLPEKKKVDQLHGRKDEFDAQEKAINEKIEKNVADLKLIDNAGASAAQLRDMLARRKADGASGSSKEGVAYSNKDIGRAGAIPSDVRHDETTVSQNGNGVSSSTTTSTDTSVSKDGISKTDTTTTSAVSGDHSGSSTDSTTNKLSKDGLTHATEHKDEQKDGDVTSSSNNKQTVQVGPKGASVTNEKNEQVDDHKIGEKTQVGVTRGDGDLGVNASKTKVNGKVDGDGNVVDGTTTTVKGDAKVHVGKDGVGAGATASADVQNVSASGVKTGVTPMCGGNVLVSIQPYAGDNEQFKKEGRFVIVTTIKITAGVKGSVGGGKEDASNVGVEASASGSVGATFQHVLSAEDTKAYLADLGGVNADNAGNGKYPEFAQIAAAWRSGWTGAKAAAADVKSAADPSKPMAEGDKIEYGADGQVDAKVKGQIHTGVVDIGAEGGVSKKASLKFSIEMVNGKRVVTVTEADESTTSEGGSVGVGGDKGVKASVGESQTKSSGKSAKFFFDPADPQAASVESEVRSATSAAEIDALIKKYPKYLSEATTSTGSKNAETIGIHGPGGVGFDMGGTGSVDHSETVDADGHKSTVDAGSNSSSGTITLPGDKKIGDTHTEAVSTKVDADGHATGDMSRTDTGTDAAKTAKDYDDRKKQEAGSAKGMIPKITGSDKGVDPQDSTDQQGMLISDGDYNTIMGAASDPAGWMKHCSSPSRMDNWRALGAAIRGAKGDKKAVGAALAQYMGKGGKEAVLEEIVRDPNADTNTGGARYEFPDGMAGLKGDYTKLVFNDPCVEVKALKDAGKDADAAAKAKEKIAALDGLYAQLQTAKDKFKDQSAVGEMLSRIGERKNQLNAFGGGAGGEAEKARQRYNDLLGNCQNFKDSENKVFDQMQAKKDDHDAIEMVALENQIRALYKDWDPAYAEMSKLGQDNGFDKSVWSKYQPDHGRWNNFHNGGDDKSLGDKRAADLEKENRQRDQDRAADDLNKHLMQTSPAAAQAQAQVQVDENVKERDAAIATQKTAIAAAKSTAQKSSAKGAVKPAGQVKMSEGWTSWKAGLSAEEHFKFVCSQQLAIAAGVNAAAADTIEKYQTAQQAFDDAHDM